MKFSLFTITVISVVSFLLTIFALLMWGAFKHEPKQRNLIAYHTNYHYILAKTYSIDVPIMESTSFGLLTLQNGRLTIKSGFAWNGATGAIDTKNRIRGSLVHDALWTLMVHDKLSKEYKEVIDDMYLKIVIEDGENEVVAKISDLVFRTIGGYFFFEDPLHYAA